MLGNLAGFDAPPPRKRRRPPLSCEQCRRRKIKCDRTNPCSQCVQSKMPACTYSDEAPRSGDGKPPNQDGWAREVTSTSSQDASWGGNSAPSLQNSSLSHFPTPGSSPRTSSFAERPSLPAGVQRRDPPSFLEGSAPSVECLLKRVQALEQALSRVASEQPGLSGGLNLSQKQGPHLKANLSKTRFYSHSHWMSYLTEFERILAYSASTATFKEGGSGAKLQALLQNCKNMAKIVKSKKVSKFVLKEDYKDYMPSRTLSDKLVESYFRTFESAHRILHIPLFRREYDQFWQDPLATDTVTTIKILLVMAIGTCFYPDNAPDAESVRASATEWIHAAQSWLSGGSEKARLNLSGLQAYCLLLLARQTSAMDDDLVWNTAGLLRMAIHLGLHRDPKYYPKVSPYNTEIRRRLWATVLEINLQAGIDFGMPALISTTDFDTEPPSNIDDDDFDVSTTVAPHSKSRTVFTQTSLQIILFESFPIRSEIVRAMNDFHAEPTYDEVLRLSKSLTEICNKYTAFIRESQLDAAKSASATNFRLTAFHQNYVDLSIRRFFLILHRLYSIRARRDPRYYFSRKVCVDTAIFLSNPAPDDDFERLLYLTRGMCREITNHLSAVIGLELIVQLEEEGGAATVPRNRSSREPLHQAFGRLIDGLEKRIVMGENNVKGHIFASAVRGQIEAIEAGTSIDEGIYEAAKESAGLCYRLLKDRTQSSSQISSNDQISQELNLMELMDTTTDVPDFSFDFTQLVDISGMTSPEDWIFGNWNENSW